MIDEIRCSACGAVLRDEDVFMIFDDDLLAMDSSLYLTPLCEGCWEDTLDSLASER